MYKNKIGHPGTYVNLQMPGKLEICADGPRVASRNNLTQTGIVASFLNLTPAKHLSFLACHQATLVLCHGKRSLVKAGWPSVP
jgi:hypothetical protein